MDDKPRGRLLNRCAGARLVATSAGILVLGWMGTACLHAQAQAPGQVQGQVQNGDVTVPLPAPGFQVRTLSAYGVYYSSSLPTNGGIPQGGSNLPSDFGFGGSAEIDWTRFTDRSTFSLTYTPSYTGFVRYSSLDALNHALSLNTTRHLAPRWNFGFSVTGSLSTFEESLFAPTTLATAASLPSSFQDLAAGLLQGQFANNPLLGSVLTSAPLAQSPLNTLLYGERMFSASVQSSLSYSYSPRLSLNFAVGGSRTQHLSDDQPLTTTNGALNLDATSGRASIGLSYSLSPLTQISASVASSRTVSPLYDLYNTTSLLSIGRTFAHRWILQAHGGAGVTNPVRETLGPIPVKPYPSGGGALTYKTTSNTFLVSYDRTVASSYGLGATTSSSANATWRFRMPGRSWWIDTSFGWQQLGESTILNTTGWRSTTGFNQAVGTHMAFRLEYAYLNYSGGLQGSPYNLSQSAVRFSVTWYPPANALR